MKRYNNSRYRHRPQKRKKRIRINKVRFTIFIFCCSAILFLAGFGIKALLTDRVDLTISMTDDLNPVEGESLYRVLLSWEPLEVDDYKEVQITVDEKEYNLTPSSTQFEVDLTEPEQSYEITFKAKKKGLVFSRQLKKVVKTFEDNQILSQDVSNFEIDKDQLSFEHLIQKNSDLSFKSKSISYEAIDVINNIHSEATIEVLEEDSEKLRQKVIIPFSQFEESPTISINMKTEINDIILLTPVKDMNLEVDQLKTESYRVVFEGSQLLLVNDNIEHYEYKSHDFYAESLYVNLNSETENATYQLTDLSGDLIKDERYNSQDHSGINLVDLSPGQYFIQFNQLPVYVSESLNEVWYTVTRNKESNQITLQSKMDSSL